MDNRGQAVASRPVHHAAVPPLRLHKGTGQGYVLIEGRRRYMGRFDLPETRQRYDRLIAEWLDGGRELPIEASMITVEEILARFWRHAEIYYRHPGGEATSSLEKFRMAMRPLRRLYGDIAAVEFGPKALKVVRTQMVERGWCRRVVNQMVGLIRHVFRRAAGEELVPVDVYTALQTVAPLKRGRCDARESEPRRPVPESDIDAVEPFVSRQVWALINLQMATGARPGELVGLRAIDIDMSGSVWVAEIEHHKNAHRGRRRTLCIGGRGQAAIRPFLAGRSVDAYLFSPCEAEAERAARAKTHRRPDQKSSKRKTERKLGDCYTTASYRRAIERACRSAGVPVWTPHRLRHNVATAIRKEFGLEAAQVVLGHAQSSLGHRLSGLTEPMR